MTQATPNKSCLSQMKRVLDSVKDNYSDLLEEWNSLQGELRQSICDNGDGRNKLQGDSVVIRKSDLALLATEVTQLKQTLPKVLNPGLVKQVGQVSSLEEENVRLRGECSSLLAEVEQWKSRCDTAVTEAQAEKQESLKLRCEMQSLSQQLSQQTDYCYSLGSSICTLLWRVSRCEESIQSILVGTKVDEFLSIVSSTLESYLAAYKGDWPQDGTEETQFILALCGTVTNIAASAYGRDFLITNQHGRQVLDTYISVLSEAPPGKSARLKNLMLMSLYNVSINQKGVKFLTSKSGFLGLTAWLLQGETDSDVRLNSLRLIQSLLTDDTNFNVVHEVEEMLPPSALEKLSRDGNKEIREFALELITDLQQLQAKS